MSFDSTLLLAFVQSATEFLPVSSSGHLILMEKLNFSHQTLLMDISLHLGTLIAVMAFFAKDICRLLIGFWHKGAEQKLGFELIIATLPALIVGFFFERHCGNNLAFAVGDCFHGSFLRYFTVDCR